MKRHALSATVLSALFVATAAPAPTPPVAESMARPRASAPPPPQLYGRARMIHAPSPCDVPAFAPGGPGAPYFVASGLPRRDQPFRVDWSTKPTSPGALPAWPAVLLVSFELATPLPLDAAGAPGCWLMVEPDYVMVPHYGSVLTQTGGSVRLDWTPNQSLVGAEFYAQLLCAAPGVNAGGFLVSPVLHVVVGG